MNAPLMRFAVAPAGQGSERRREQRFNTSHAAQVFSSTGEGAGVLLVDVSAHGCCIRCDAPWMKTGRFVSIHLEQDPALDAVVRWIRDGSVGLEFLRPVPTSSQAWFDLMDDPFVG